MQELTGAMEQALLAMPISPDSRGCLPASAPHANLLRALERRDLIRFTGRRWELTDEGRAEARARRA